ncbi:hypothetical protein [Brevibacillus dissolubilis]|uniref:hypothetical protein n=1 Tax=Brevibacillus dissolubilis TaxID=1844116 RepID=UPI0011164241|nr:hypothetical protein [Brevibacillus dissolubilis]
MYRSQTHKADNHQSAKRSTWKKRFSTAFHALLTITLLSSYIPPSADAAEISPVSEWTKQLLDGETVRR